MVTYTFTNGTAANASEVNQNFIDVTPKFYKDNIGGSVSNSTTETDLASITIPQDELGISGNIVLNTGFLYESDGSATCTFRVYVGGVVQKTITETGGIVSGRSVNLSFDGVDTSSGDVIVKVSAEWNVAGSAKVASTESLVVIGTRV